MSSCLRRPETPSSFISSASFVSSAIVFLLSCETSSCRWASCDWGLDGVVGVGVSMLSLLFRSHRDQLERAMVLRNRTSQILEAAVVADDDVGQFFLPRERPLGSDP